jgi:hypothetical protein
MTNYPGVQSIGPTTGHAEHDYHGARQVNLTLHLVDRWLAKRTHVAARRANGDSWNARPRRADSPA